MAEIIFEDDAVLVVRKPAGTESQRGKSFAMDLESELKNYLAVKQPGRAPYLAVVHRLDRPVTGVMVYAKTKAAAAALSRQFSQGTAHKVYEALLLGCPEPKEGRLRDRLETDARTNFTRVAAKEQYGEAKEAELLYRVIPVAESSVFTLTQEDGRLTVRTCGSLTGSVPAAWSGRICAVRIELLTGRHHQIRVQFAHAGAPVLGDTRYGTPESGLQMRGKIALCAAQLSFRHPTTEKKLSFRA